MNPCSNREALERLYVEGRNHCKQRTQVHLQKGLDCFRRACELDPSSARAWSGLADAHTLLYTYHLMPFEEAHLQAREAVARSLALDEGLAEAHASAGQVKATFERDQDGAQREFDTALELDPTCVTARHWRAGLASRAGRLGEALEDVKLALEVDPTYPVLLTSRALLEARLGRWDEALESFEEALALQPSDEAIRLNFALVLTQTGDTDRALAVIRRALELAPQSAFARGVYATILYYARQYDLAIEQLEAAADHLADLPPMGRIVLGLAHLQKDDCPRALAEFDRASQRSGEYTGETDLTRVADCLQAITRARMGDLDGAREALERLESQPSALGWEPCWLGVLCFALGRTAEGFDWLEKAERSSDMWIRYLAVQPLFDPVRSNPRFTALLERMGLSDRSGFAAET